jgi:CRP-like cAMP-binding protein
MTCKNCNCPFYDIQCVIADCTHDVEFREDEVLFMQGQASSNLYSLTDGMVKICTHTPDGREQIVGLSTPSNLLVGLQSLSDKRYAYTAIAATPVGACRINHRALLARVRDQGEVAMRLIKAINAQLAYSRALMEVMGHRCAASKIASFILLLTPRSVHGNCEFSMPFSRVEMASLLGLSEETVCRSMATMKRQGAIYAPRGHVEIRDWDCLQDIANGDTNGHMAA